MIVVLVKGDTTSRSGSVLDKGRGICEVPYTRAHTRQIPLLPLVHALIDPALFLTGDIPATSRVAAYCACLNTHHTNAFIRQTSTDRTLKSWLRDNGALSNVEDFVLFPVSKHASSHNPKEPPPPNPMHSSRARRN